MFKLDFSKKDQIITDKIMVKTKFFVVLGMEDCVEFEDLSVW